MPYLQPVFVTARRDNAKSAILHRSAIAAVDRLTSPTPTAAKNDNITGVMAAAAHYYGISAGNRYGAATPVLGAGTITPTVNKTVDVAIEQVTGAEWYDVFYSTAAAPLWLGRITEAMRANGCAITAVGTAAAVYQVETVQVTHIADSAGTLVLTITGAPLAGGAKIVNCDVAASDTAAQVAVKVRAALSADADVGAAYTAGGSTDYVSATAKVGAANDATLEIALTDADSTGVTFGASVNTTWGIDPGKCSVRLVGTGVATNAAPFTANNAFTPAATGITAIDCAGKTTAHIYTKCAVTDLRSLPTLKIAPFIKNYTTGDFAQGTVVDIAPMSDVSHGLIQVSDVDVNGASGLVVLVHTITGQGTTATIHVELS
jgi:hypothetical protein